MELFLSVAVYPEIRLERCVGGHSIVFSIPLATVSSLRVATVAIARSQSCIRSFVNQNALFHFNVKRETQFDERFKRHGRYCWNSGTERKPDFDSKTIRICSTEVRAFWVSSVLMLLYRTPRVRSFVASAHYRPTRVNRSAAPFCK